MSGIQTTFAHRETIIVNQNDINRKINNLFVILYQLFKKPLSNKN